MESDFFLSYYNYSLSVTDVRLLRFLNFCVSFDKLRFSETISLKLSILWAELFIISFIILVMSVWSVIMILFFFPLLLLICVLFLVSQGRDLEIFTDFFQRASFWFCRYFCIVLPFSVPLISVFAPFCLFYP